MTRNSSYWLAGLCLAWLFAGSIGHAPWKGPDAETFARLLAAREQADWLFPDNAGAPPVYLWLAQLLGKALSSLLPLHDGARLASSFFIGVSLWLTALAARRLYGEQAIWPSVLALMGCMGLLVPAHEANVFTAQLAAMSLFVYGLARMLTQPLTGGGFAGLALAGLFLSGAWLASLALACALFLLPAVFPSWRTSARVGGSWFALTAALAISGVWLLTVKTHQPERLLGWWEHAALGKLVFFAGAKTKYNPIFFVNALTWFAWPAWPIAGWAVYRLRRGGWDSVKLWMPLGIFVVVLTALSLKSSPEQLETIVLLPPLAILAGAGLGELRRGAANALLWFAFMVFSFFALLFWVYWAAFDLGWPAQMSRRLAKLGMESHGLRPLALGLGLVITFGWVAWVAWLRSQQRNPLRPILVWNAGVTFVWCLLLALFMKPLDARLSYVQTGEAMRSRIMDKTCVENRNLSMVHARLLSYHGSLDIRSSDTAACSWMLVYEKDRRPVHVEAGWQKRWVGGRPGERNERFVLYQREQRY